MYLIDLESEKISGRGKKKKKKKKRKIHESKKIKEEIEEELFLPLRSRGGRKIRKLPHFGAR